MLRVLNFREVEIGMVVFWKLPTSDPMLREHGSVSIWGRLSPTTKKSEKKKTQTKIKWANALSENPIHKAFCAMTPAFTHSMVKTPSWDFKGAWNIILILGHQSNLNSTEEIGTFIMFQWITLCLNSNRTCTFANLWE